MTIQYELMKSLALHGDRTAIADPYRSVSYRRLSALSDKVATQLIAAGVAPETVVGICLHNRIDLICSLIGVLKARCVFVLLDGQGPAGRLSDMVLDAAPGHVLTSKHTAETGLFGAAVVHNVEEIFEESAITMVAGGNGADLPGRPVYEANDSIYIYFTSGTTGRPKGIVGRNGSLLQFIQWEISEFGIGAGTRVSQLVSPYFDAFLRDVFVPLLAGGTICIPPSENDFFSGEKMTRWIDTEGINLIHCVPSVFRMINTGLLSPAHFKQLKYILLSGEKIVPGELQNWYDVFGDAVQLVNFYGATETTMIRCFYRIRPADVQLNRIPIGFPIAGTRLLVATDDLRPCSKLAPGDLYIISDYTSKGYLNDPDLTAKKFIKINAGLPDETIAFKTGDRGRMLADGSVDLLGREDRQVKLRGIRVEPEEIEAVLTRSGLLANAVVVHHKDMNQEGGGLVAFVIAKNETPLPDALEAALRQFMENYLPEHMVPAIIVQLAAYPLLSNGKINYRELLHQLPAGNLLTPANETEQALLVIWKEILGNKPISTEDNFFIIGGSSLSIMRLTSRIYKEMNIRISLDELFNNLTIRKQAALLQKHNTEKLYLIPVSENKPGYHLSAAQHRIYYNYELNRNGTAFNLPMVWEIKASVDKKRIAAALQSLVERHEILRTAFTLLNGEVCQTVQEGVSLQVTEMHCAAEELQQLVSVFVQPFQLEKAPLIRATILYVNDGRELLLIDTHHIVCDGQSQVNLLSDFIKLYRGETLVPLPVQYRDYAEWEHQFRQLPEYIYHREFWLRNFRGDIPQLQWPVKRKSRPAGNEQGSSIQFSIGRSDIQPLEEWLQQQGVTLFSGCFSLFMLYLYRFTGNEELVIGINSSGRMQEELDGAVGMFAKTLPIRCSINPALDFCTLVKDVHERLVQAQSRQVYDLADMVSELNKHRQIPVKNFFDTMFVYQKFDTSSVPPGDEGFVPFEFGNHTSKYTMTLFVTEETDRLFFRWEYSTTFFTKTDMEQLVTEFTELVHDIAGDTGGSIMDRLHFAPGNEKLVPEEDIAFNF